MNIRNAIYPPTGRVVLESYLETCWIRQLAEEIPIAERSGAYRETLKLEISEWLMVI